MSHKVAVIDMICHKKTKSFDFFLKLLYQQYGEKNVDIFYDYSDEWWPQELWYMHNKGAYKLFIFLEILPSAITLYKLRGKNIIYVPMYDLFHPYVLFLSYLKIFKVRVVSFSSRVHDFFYSVLGMNSLYIQYYLPPLPYGIDYNKKNIFWRYRGTVTWQEIKRIIGTQKINKLTIKNMPDAGYKKLIFTDADIERYNISIIEKFFPTHEEHYENLAAHNIFIAPRRKEGIGMSFLDALSLGMCVVWYNGATMDEYITDSVDGLLTDFSMVISLDKHVALGKAAKDRYTKWYEQWQIYKQKLIAFLDIDCPSTDYSLYKACVYSAVYYMLLFAANTIWKIKMFIRSYMD